MKYLFKSKDGGSESNVTGYWLIESKSLFSVVLLRFDEGSREAYHNHAFTSISWVLSGMLHERVFVDTNSIDKPRMLHPSIKPVLTYKNTMHKVFGMAKYSWVISFRGPWNSTWKEYFASSNKFETLTHGRKVLHENHNN